MTVKECIKTSGIEVTCTVTHHIWGEVVVYFWNKADSCEDSVSFDVKTPLTRDGSTELERLYKDFCKENRNPANTVKGIVLSRVAETYDELVAGAFDELFA